MARTESLLPPIGVLSVVTEAIDLYWDNVLEGENTLRITSRGKVERDDSVMQETWTVQRIYETAYWMKCALSRLTHLGEGKIDRQAEGTIEYKIMPLSLAGGRITVKHTDPVGFNFEGEVSLGDLEEEDSQAADLLSHLQQDLLMLLAKHCGERDIFDPLPAQVRQLLEKAYDPKRAKELWEGMMEQGGR